MSEPNVAPEAKTKPFAAENAKQGRAVCKKCKQKCLQGELRIAKLVPNPFDAGSGKMKNWHHLNCIFEMFAKQRPSTRRIESSDDIDGWDSLGDSDRDAISKKIEDCKKVFEAKTKTSTKTKNAVSKVVEDYFNISSDENHKDNLFREFRRIISNVASVSSSAERIAIFREIFSKGSDGSGFKGDKMLWCKLLLPAVIKRDFNLETKQLIKIFSKMFQVTEKDVTEHLEEGDIGQTIQHFYDQNKKFKPAKKSTLTIFDVDDFLKKLSAVSKEDEQYNLFEVFAKKCTANDLKIVVRLIKHDLRMGAGEKHVFQGLHPDAYETFQKCRDIKSVFNTCFAQTESSTAPKKKKTAEFPNLQVEKSRVKKRKASSTASAAKKKKLSQEKDVESDDLRKSQTIPNYFTSVKLLLEEGVAEKHAEWVRYFIAYGGTVLKCDESAEATHVLHLKDTVAEPVIECAATARHVIVEWIKDTVSKESLQDFRPYSVRWKPSFKN